MPEKQDKEELMSMIWAISIVVYSKYMGPALYDFSV